MRPSTPQALRFSSSVFAAWLGVFLVVAPGIALAQGTEATPLGPAVGHPVGAVVIAGGGTLGSEIWTRFVELAGGSAARIVVIPTAAEEDEFPEDWSILASLADAGAAYITLLHTRDRDIADTDAFAAPLREATGVWIPGGRQHRLVDAYLDTQVHDELFRILDRGGVIGGSSAGASILASFLVRGDPATNQRVMSEDYLKGFGVLEGTAIDQHLLVRGREQDLWTVLERYPELLGIGIDEGTALVIEGDLAEVVGVSQVLIYSMHDSSGIDSDLQALVEGDRFHLSVREPLPALVSGSGRSPTGEPSAPEAVTVPATSGDAADAR